MGREMNGQVVENGVYQSRSHGTKFFPDRDVYIQNGIVRLVNDFDKTLFGYDFFFKVNTLGPKIDNLPTDFAIATTIVSSEPQGQSAAQLVFAHHQKIFSRFTEEHA